MIRAQEAKVVVGLGGTAAIEEPGVSARVLVGIDVPEDHRVKVCKDVPASMDIVDTTSFCFFSA